MSRSVPETSAGSFRLAARISVEAGENPRGSRRRLARARARPTGMGNSVSAREAFDQMDTDKSGELDFTEFVMYFGPE